MKHMNRITYYSYDPSGTGFSFHATEEAARNTAQEAIDAERECVDDCDWPDYITDISWGIVNQSAEKVGNDYELK